MSRYILHYLGQSDPSSEEEGKLLSSLRNTKIIDRMPGAVLVDAAESELASITKKLTKWSFTPDVAVSVNPPRKRILHPL